MSIEMVGQPRHRNFDPFGALLMIGVIAVLAVVLMGPRGSLWPAEKVRVTGLTATTLQGAIDGGELAGNPTFEFCKTIEVPATDEEFYTIFRAPAALTFSEIYCEIDDGGATSVLFDFENDDGSVTGVNGSDITCTPAAGGGTTDSSLGGDKLMDAGHRLDMDLGAVNGDVDLFSACIRYTLD